MAGSKQSLFAPLALAVAALTSQGRATPAALAAKPLGAHAIHAALAQNTLSVSTANGSTARVYLAPNDVMRGTFGGRKVKGHWSIKGNKLCLRYPQKRDSGCWSVLRHRNGSLQLFDASGTPAGDLGVSKGNPHHY